MVELGNIVCIDSIHKSFTYERSGKVIIVEPIKDCMFEEGEDELLHIQKISGDYFFYGAIKTEVSILYEKEKVKQIVLEASVATKTEIKLLEGNSKVVKKENKVRVTDSVIKNHTAFNPELVDQKNKVLELKEVVNKLDIILKALSFKHETLLEVSRRKKLEIKLDSRA